MGKGFVDLHLEPFLIKHPGLKYHYLIELKYIKRGDFSEQAATEALAAAREQLLKYAGDERVVRGGKGTTLKRLALVFSGWELKTAKEYSTTYV